MASGTKKFNELIQREPFCAIPADAIFDHDDFKKNTGHMITPPHDIKIGDQVHKVHIVFNYCINKYTLREALIMISLQFQKYIVGGDIWVFDIIKFEHLSLAHRRHRTIQILENIGVPGVLVSIVNEYL